MSQIDINAIIAAAVQAAIAAQGATVTAPQPEPDTIESLTQRIFERLGLQAHATMSTLQKLSAIERYLATSAIKPAKAASAKPADTPKVTVYHVPRITACNADGKVIMGNVTKPRKVDGVQALVTTQGEYSAQSRYGLRRAGGYIDGAWVAGLEAYVQANINAWQDLEDVQLVDLSQPDIQETVGNGGSIEAGTAYYMGQPVTLILAGIEQQYAKK